MVKLNDPKNLINLTTAGILYSKYNETKKEKYNESNNSMSLLSFLLALIMSLTAVYLSWSCNTIKNVPVILKIFFAFFAFLFGPIYLLCYAMFIQPCKGYK